MAEILGAPRIAVRARPTSAVRSPDWHRSRSRSWRVSIRRQDPRRHTDANTNRVVGVALVRDEGVIASPEPDQDLVGGDVLVVIGTSEGISKARAIVEAQ